MMLLGWRLRRLLGERLIGSARCPGMPPHGGWFPLLNEEASELFDRLHYSIKQVEKTLAPGAVGSRGDLERDFHGWSYSMASWNGDWSWEGIVRRWADGIEGHEKPSTRAYWLKVRSLHEWRETERMETERMETERVGVVK